MNPEEKAKQLFDKYYSNIPEERMQGINAGLKWKEVADLQVFYIDYGISEGMQYGMDYAKKHNIPFETRTIL